MERYVLWYRGEGEKTRADVEPMLPAGAYLLQSAPRGLFLVLAERFELEDVFACHDGWIIAADNLVA
jgi:hypothetical protein